MKTKFARITCVVISLILGISLGKAIFRGGVQIWATEENQTKTQSQASPREHSKCPQYPLAMAEVHFKFGNTKEAESLATQAMKGVEDPATRKQLRDLLAKIFEKEQRWDEALKLEQQAAKEPVDEHEKYEASLSQAKIHAQLNQLEKAEETLNSLAPTTQNVWCKREISKAFSDIWLKDPARMNLAFEQAKADESKRSEVTTALEIVGLEYKNTRRDPKYSRS